MGRLQYIPIKFVLAMLFITLIDCTSNKVKHKKYIKKYYLNGELKKEGYFIDGTIPVDTIKVYNKEGYLIAMRIYDEKGELARVCLYYKNGSIEQEKDFSNGNLNGICRNFYTNGDIESIGHFFNGIQVGDTKFYSEEGYINLYNFYDFSGRNRVVREYDSSGKYIMDIGNKLFIDSSFAINDTLVSLDTFKTAILIAHPPKTRINIHIEELDSAKNILKKHKINKSKYLVFLSLPITKELYIVRVICSQFDSINNKNRVMIKNTILK